MPEDQSEHYLTWVVTSYRTIFLEGQLAGQLLRKLAKTPRLRWLRGSDWGQNRRSFEQTAVCHRCRW